MNTDTQRLHRLMEVGHRLLSELDPDEVFTRVLAEARAVTGARHAALGVLSDSRTELTRFLTDGLDPDVERQVGEAPRGRGVLGLLIDSPVPLRVDDVTTHPERFGFPAGHPDMHSFLGVPIIIQGRAWGNLYLTDKQGAVAFTDADEASLMILAEFAATAIENARLYQRAEAGRQDLMRAVRGLEAARTISDAIGAEADLETILELIVKRGRALVTARSVMILLREGDELVIAAGTGTTGDRRGTRIAITGTVSGQVLRSGLPHRVSSVPDEMSGVRNRLGIADVQTALVMPMIHRGAGIGVLIALDRGAEQGTFTDADEEIMHTFAASAANAVAISHSVEADRLRATIEAAEDERRRWARELHDQTLQALGGLRVQLSGARRHDRIEIFRETVGQAISDLESEIRSLRGIISDLRPPLLDDLGLADALVGLVDRHRDGGLCVELQLDLNCPGADSGPAVLSPELETAVYRLIQEALANVARHAQATVVEIRLEVGEDGRLRLEVLDDGVGFDLSAPRTGFGLGSIRERVYLAGGTLGLESGSGGTQLRAEIPC